VRFYPPQVESRLVSMFRARPNELDWIPQVYERCFSRTLAATYAGKLYVDALRESATAPQHVALFGPMQLDFGTDTRLCYGVEHKTVAELLADVTKRLVPVAVVEPTEVSSASDALLNKQQQQQPDRFFFKAAAATTEGVPVWEVKRIDPQAIIVV
jgi:hypothetical protein